MRIICRLLPLIAILLSLAGCQATNADRLGPSGMPKGTVNHVVLMWLRNRADLHAQEQIIEAGKRLEKIPGVLRVVAGRVLTSERSGIDSSFDVAYIFTFRDESEMKHYLADPQFTKDKTEFLEEYVDKFVAYDFVTE